MDDQGIDISEGKQSKIKIDERILDYIRQELKKGFSKEEIKETLVKAGHHPSHIEQHLNSLESKNKRKNILLYLLVFFVLISVFSIIVNFALYKKLNYSKTYDEIVYESKDLCAKGQYDKAFKKLDKAVKLDNKNAFGFAIMGYCYLLQNKSEDAILALIEAIKRSSREPLYFYRLGVAYCNLDSYNLGIANLRRSIDLNPGNPDFYKSLAECYSKAGNEEEANKYLNTLNEIKSKTNSTNK